MRLQLKKTIALPAKLVRQAEARAKADGKTLSAVIREALREYLNRKRRHELCELQHYWSRTAREQGILSERDLERYLRS